MPSDCVAARRPMSRWRVGRHPVPCRSQQYFRGGKDHAHRAYYEEATLQLAAVTLAPIRAAGTHDGVAEELLKDYSVYCSSRLLKKTHMLRYRSIASLQRTVSTPPLVDSRAPCIWIFLSSLQEAFFSTLLGSARRINKEVRGKTSVE
jgi:hypothetical protein